MEKFIEVYDNILDPKLEDFIEELILGKGNLPYFYVDNLTFEKHSPDHYFKPGITLPLIVDNLHRSKFAPIINNIVYNFCFSKGYIAKTIMLSRIFIDFPAPSPKLDWPPHIDQSEPHWVCLYYVNDSDGDTVFFGEDKKEIKRVSPKKGRIAFFDGSIYHAGTPSGTNSRAVVNFNFTTTSLTSLPYL